MTRNTKIILGILAGLVLICLCVGGVALYVLRQAGETLVEGIQTAPADINRTGAGIADYDLPEGYSPSFGTQMAGISMAAYQSEDGHSHIMLFQVPESMRMDPADLQRQMRQTRPADAGDQPAEMQMVETRMVTLRGQEVKLVMSEGTNSSGVAYREASVVFDGKGGQALLSISGPVSTWDEAAVDEFLASMK
jgi:membrane-bound inhibitor of C-type lysozyme